MKSSSNAQKTPSKVKEMSPVVTKVDNFMKQIDMFSKSPLTFKETPKKNTKSPGIRASFQENSKEESPFPKAEAFSTEGSSSKKKVGFHLKPSTSETKSKEISPSAQATRSFLYSLFPLSSSDSPKFVAVDEDEEKPDLPYKFYNDGSYELAKKLEILTKQFQSDEVELLQSFTRKLLDEHESFAGFSASLRELMQELRETQGDSLRFLIEDRTDAILEGRSPIRKKNYLLEFKAKLKEGSLKIAAELGERLKIATFSLMESYDCLLKRELEQVLERFHANLLQTLHNFLYKTRIYDYNVCYLYCFREELRELLADVPKGSDAELFSEIERVCRTNKADEYIEFVFKIQQILLRVEKPSRFPSELRTKLELQLQKAYYEAFRLDFMRFLFTNKVDSYNYAIYKALHDLLEELPIEDSAQLLEKVAGLFQENLRKGNSDFWAKGQLLHLRCNMILYRLGLQNLVKKIPKNEYNQLNFLIMERLYEKSLEDSPEIYPEVSEILENNPRIGTSKFKQALAELSSKFQFNKVKKESNKPILKAKSNVNNSLILPLNLIDSSQMLNESNLDISMSPCDATEMLEYKEISPKILILESSKAKTLSKQDYLGICENIPKGKKFNDDIFLSNFSSLCFSSSKPAFPEWKAMKWLRLGEMYRGRKTTLLANISSSFLRKNKETPQYLVNALTLLSENEFVLNRNFEEQGISEKGIYFVKICQDGIWRYVILDDFFPCWNDKRGNFAGFLDVAAYEKNTFDVWPLLITKALAKMYTTYQSIASNGCFAHILRDLTGAPITVIPLDEKKDTLTKKLKIAYDKGLILAVGGVETAQNQEKEEVKTTEIAKNSNKNINYTSNNSNNSNSVNNHSTIPKENNSNSNNKKTNNNNSINHDKTNKKTPSPLDLSLVYQVIGVIMIKSSTYFEITNPFIDISALPEEFSTKSAQIFDKIKQINQEDYLLMNTDHSIFLDFADFTEIFSEVTVCNLYPEYFYVARSITHVKNTYCIRTFTLQSSSHCFLEVSQVDKRYFRGLDYDYSPVRILIGKVDGVWNTGNHRPPLIYIAGMYKRARNVNIELNLEKGTYWVLIGFDWAKNTYDATLNYYGQEKILLEKVSYNVNRGLLEDFGTLISKAYGQKIKLQGDKIVLFFYASTYDCLIVEHLVNNFNNKTVFLTRDYSFLDQIKICLVGKFSKMQKIDIRVDPLKTETIMFRVNGIDSLEKLHSMLENKFLNDYKLMKVK